MSPLGEEEEMDFSLPSIHGKTLGSILDLFLTVSRYIQD